MPPPHLSIRPKSDRDSRHFLISPGRSEGAETEVVTGAEEGSERVLSNTAVTKCLTVAPPVVEMMFSLEKASLKQMTRHRARTSPLQTVLVVTRRVKLCKSLTSSMLASINIHMVSTTYLAPLLSRTWAVINLWITWTHKFTIFVSLVSQPLREKTLEKH